MRHILIIGKNSYIGESVKKWLERYPKDYHVEIAGSVNGVWKKTDFSKFDTVIDSAGIAHINHITEDMRELFYSVNTDLSIEIAAWAKEHGVSYFIFFSSMNVYGDCCGYITDRRKTNPTSFYGDSKLQGDMGIQKLAGKGFKVASLRPPFVYGKGCSGNYRGISRIAKRTPVFPDYKNKKSMIYIDNLCEFVRMIIDDRASGCFTPQNKELVSTADLVREIVKCSKRKIWFPRMFNWAVRYAAKRIKLFRRAFADDCYDLSLSDYYGFKYCLVDFDESIRRTEGL